MLVASELSSVRPMVAEHPRIAVVDDEADVLRALQRLLRSSGYAVDVYATGEAFLHAVSGDCPDCPDCLLLDLHMPGISGFEVQARLRASNCLVPVVVITGHDTSSAEGRAMAGGAVAFLRKPVDGELLLATIERAIGAG